MATSTGASDQLASQESSLCARLWIEPHPKASCAILDAGDRGEEIDRNEVCRDDSSSDVGCRAVVTVVDDGYSERRLVAAQIGQHCICPAFRQNDCVVDIRTFRDGAMLVSVAVPSRRALRDIVSSLRDRGASVRLEQILPLSPQSEDDRRIELDAKSITEKQREAIDTAVRTGYYATPRRAGLDDLADELGVSRSAVSQRLNAAESKLAREFISADGQDRRS